MRDGGLRRRNYGYKGDAGLSSLQQPLLQDDEEDESPRSSHVGSSASLDGPASYSKYLESKAWQDNLVNLVAQWVAWFGDVMKGAGSVILNLGGSVLSLLQIPVKSESDELPFEFTEKQRENLTNLKRRLSIPFDGNLTEHQDALRALWRSAYPNVKLTGMISEQWKEMGWQGTDPSTDFRGGGFISLENLLNFAYKYPGSFRKILNKENGKRSDWEYPFAVAGLNLTFMLAQMLDLRAEIPSKKIGQRFVEFLGDDESAFDELYCVAFEVLDAEWLSMRASYMEFNAVLKSVKAKLEQSLMDPAVKSVSEMPSYLLLSRT